MDEKSKQNPLDRAAWIVIGVWLVLLRFFVGMGESRIGGIACFGFVLTLITTWIGWCCGMFRGQGSKGAFYGFASGLLIVLVACVAIVFGVAQRT